MFASTKEYYEEKQEIVKEALHKEYGFSPARKDIVLQETSDTRVFARVVEHYYLVLNGELSRVNERCQGL
jgi:hypothetical protein